MFARVGCLPSLRRSATSWRDGRASIIMGRNRDDATVFARTRNANGVVASGCVALQARRWLQATVHSCLQSSIQLGSRSIRPLNRPGTCVPPPLGGDVAPRAPPSHLAPPICTGEQHQEAPSCSPSPARRLAAAPCNWYRDDFRGARLRWRGDSCLHVRGSKGVSVPWRRRKAGAAPSFECL